MSIDSELEACQRAYVELESKHIGLKEKVAFLESQAEIRLANVHVRLSKLETKIEEYALCRKLKEGGHNEPEQGANIRC